MDIAAKRAVTERGIGLPGRRIGQAQYLSAREKEKYARESYELTSEQFRVGVKNTVELITAQNEYSAAQQQVLQAKYLTLLSIELLNIYQGLPASDIY